MERFERFGVEAPPMEAVLAAVFGPINNTNTHTTERVKDDDDGMRDESGLNQSHTNEE